MRLTTVVIAAVAFAACAHQPIASAATDGRFKMVHQVSATYDGQQYLMTGYLLAKPDGNFRVSAAALMGPRLFDVARIDGQWRAKVHLKQLQEKLDPKYLGRAIERVYFRDCEPGRRCSIADDEEVDSLEVDRENGQIARKRFFMKGALVLDIDYQEREAFSDGSVRARHIELKAPKYQIVIELESYEPNFGFDDSMLEP